MPAGLKYRDNKGGLLPPSLQCSFGVESMHETLDTFIL